MTEAAMTFARMLLEIKRRAASAPHDVSRVVAVRQAARDVFGLSDDEEVDVAALESLTPEEILRIDMSLSDASSIVLKKHRK